MMKTLYLLRHAHTDPPTPPLMRDYDRILSPKGAEEALALAETMINEKISPDLVLSSPSARTVQTTELIFETLFHKTGVKTLCRFDRNLYLVPAEKILLEVQITDNAIEKLMIVGHSPGLADLAMALGRNSPHPEFSAFAPCTLAIFTSSCKNWDDFSPATAAFAQIFLPKG